MRRLQVAALALVFCSLSLPALAQQGTAEISGKVSDESGAVLPGVALVVTNQDTGVFRELVSNPDGSYFVSQIVPGSYRITAKLTGFRTLERRDILVEVGRTKTVDLTLPVGSLEESVTVSVEAPLVDTTSAEVGGHISSNEIAELPQGNRSYMALVGNVPGVQFTPTTGFLNDTFIANGQPAAANNISFDGVANVDDFRGSNVGGQVRTANETIQEVQVMTNQFDAEYGRASGAVINAVTKSGTNRFSGSAFDFFTGAKVTAADYFTKLNDAEKPVTKKQEWGGTAGGPIVKNKLHFFASVERLVQNRNESKTYPTHPEFSFATVDDVSAWNTFWRIDHQISGNTTWSFRWQREVAPQFNVLDGAKDTVQSNDDETDRDQTIVGVITTVLSNTKVNTFRVGLTKEATTHATADWRALNGNCISCDKSLAADQSKLPPVLSYNSFNLQAAPTMDIFADDAYAYEETFSWFVPDKWGKHDLKFGGTYTYVSKLQNVQGANQNGTYTFSHDNLFDPASARTYPDRFSIRVGGPFDLEMKSRTYEAYAQDKWQVKSGLTVSAGLRYDLEVIPVNEAGNPLFKDPGKYPVDKNNVSPRLGLVWNPDKSGKAVLRAGFGIFYDRTILGTVDDTYTNAKFLNSFVATFPINAADPGPTSGLFPTDPTLLTTSVSTITPAVRAYINSLYPGGLGFNTGTIAWDSPDRQQPKFYQATVGYQRELVRGFSVSADYVRMMGRDMFMQPNLNIGTRINTTRTGRIDFTNPFGVLDQAYPSTVREIATIGYNNYDALDLSVERRFAQSWSVRGAYTLSYSRGVSAGQTDTPQLQVGTDLNLDDYYAPANVDRRHNVLISGRVDVPKTHGVTVSGVLRMMSGTPFTIQNTNIDADRNGILFDPLAAGTYSGTAPGSLQDVENKGGRNGARGPGFMQLDMRAGYRAKLGSRRTLDVFGEVFNVTNHVNFTNPSGDLRVTSDFLRLTGLVATSGLPRQAQLGLRLGF